MIDYLRANVGEIELAWRLALLPGVALALIAVVARMTQGSWLAPGAAWAGFWAAATWLPLLLASKYPVSPSATWVIVGFTLAIYLGSQFGQANRTGRTPSATRTHPNRFMPLLCWIGTGAGFLMTGLTLIQYQSTWSVWLSPSRLGELANTISIARYAGEANESVLVRFCLVFCYLGSLAGGHVMGWRQGRHLAWWSLGPLLAALSYALLTTAKAGVLIAVLLWLSAYATESMRRRGRGWRAGWKAVLLGTFAVCLVVTLFVTAMMLRYGFDQTEDREFVIERLRNYSVSHLTAFSSWWDSDTRDGGELGWGRQSLFGPAALLNLSVRQQGVYDSMISPRYPVDSNLFTLYRSIIADFSLPGALLVMAGIGYLAGRAYRKILRHPGAAGAATFLTAFYATLGWSHIVNIFGYTTMLVAFALYILVSGGFRRSSAGEPAMITKALPHE